MKLRHLGFFLPESTYIIRIFGFQFIATFYHHRPSICAVTGRSYSDSLTHRLKQALQAGFRHLVFEDNYDTGTGDHYSLRHICDQFYIRGACSFIFLF